MKKIGVIALAALLAVSLAGCSKKAENKGITIEPGVLKIGMEIGYPPFEYYAEDGKTPSGFDVELGKAVAAKMGLRAEFVDTAWDGIFAAVDTGKIDVIMSAMTITDERKATHLFSKPYIGNGQALVLTKNSKVTARDPMQLTGLGVGYQAETTSDIFMTKLAQEKGLKFTAFEYDKVLNAFDDLKNGRCDAVVSDALVAVDYINKPDSPFVMVWQAPADEFFGVCMKQAATELQTQVDKALDELFADGTVQKISQDIFHADMVSFARQPAPAADGAAPAAQTK